MLGWKTQWSASIGCRTGPCRPGRGPPSCSTQPSSPLCWQHGRLVVLSMLVRLGLLGLPPRERRCQTHLMISPDLLVCPPGSLRCLVRTSVWRVWRLLLWHRPPRVCFAGSGRPGVAAAWRSGHHPAGLLRKLPPGRPPSEHTISRRWVAGENIGDRRRCADRWCLGPFRGTPGLVVDHRRPGQVDRAAPSCAIKNDGSAAGASSAVSIDSGCEHPVAVRPVPRRMLGPGHR